MADLRRSTLAAACLAAAFATPAFSQPTCVIVVPTDQRPGNLSPHRVYEHELAHTNGWVHGSDGTNVRNLIPPRSYVHKPTHCALEVMRVPTDVAEKVCRAMGGDSYACEWEE